MQRNLRLELGFTVQTVSVIIIWGTNEWKGNIQVFHFPCAFPIANPSPLCSSLLEAAPCATWWEANTGLLGDGSLHSVPPCWDITLPKPKPISAEEWRIYAASSDLCVPAVILWQHPSFKTSRPGVWGSYWLPGESFYHLAWKGDSWMW